MNDEARRQGAEHTPDEVAEAGEVSQDAAAEAPDHPEADDLGGSGEDTVDLGAPGEEPAAAAEAANAPGHAPGDLWADDLLDEPEPEEGPSAAARDLRATLQRYLAQHDKPTFVRTAVEAVTNRRLTIPELYRDVLTPLLVDTGAGWQHGRVAIWEEHMATAMVRTVVEILYPGVLKAKLAAPPAGRSVLLASPPEEVHDLGLRMIADRFDIAGWTTYFVGADSPIEETVDAARKLGVDAVVLSSATHYHRLALRGYVDQLARELDHVHVWVGGSAFVGGTEGWASYEVRDLDTLLAEFTPGPTATPAAPAEEPGAPEDAVSAEEPATPDGPAGAAEPAGDETPAADDVAPAAGDEG
jgi:MerR family transcriptional regulator, light-induced transcriptional regulator